MPYVSKPETPAQALARLVDGNRRFREAGRTGAPRPWSAKLASEPQRPFAVIVGCADSRVPVELLFDAGFADLFVVRVAGNVATPAVVGSVEFAASQCDARLVVVMGHTGCGAVTATVEALRTGRAPDSENLRAITERIAPHIDAPVREQDAAAAVRAAVRANVRATAEALRHDSRILAELVDAGRVVVVGAEYELETGAVEFFDGVPDRGE